MNLLLVLPILVPLATAVAGILLLRVPRAARWASALGAAGLLAASLALLEATLDGTILVTQAGAWPAPFGITLVADRFAAAMVVVGAVLLAAVVGYSVSGLDRARERARGVCCQCGDQARSRSLMLVFERVWTSTRLTMTAAYRL